MKTDKYHLFISYADADRAWVEGYLLVSLKQAGIHYHSEAAFTLGTVRIKEFERSIQQSQRTLLILSPAYLADGSNQFVDLLAQCYGLDTATWPVIPLILQPVQLPPRLSILVKLSATNPDEWEEAIERLCSDLKRSVPGPVAKPPCPYPGMVPFSEEMSDRFFGRDREVQEILECLRLYPFLAVIGPSGSGKSSLVFAGLIPALRRTGLFASREWLVCTMRPGETPLARLATALGRDDLVKAAQTGSVALSSSPLTEPLLLAIDQFEEVFTLAQQEALTFQETLKNLLGIPNLFIVLTVRADFYAELMASPLWPKIQGHRIEVTPLDREGLCQAILKPADKVGVFVEAALLERLVVDATDEPGVLPLVQETLVLLWERLERRFLPLQAYEALVLSRKVYGGEVDRQRTGLQVAIARRADAAIADLSPIQQTLARRIFLRLVQFGEGRTDTRRQQSVPALQSADDDPQLFDTTLRHLADCRLLTLSGDETTSRKADIAHEALISGWPTLQNWIRDRREAEQTRRRLEGKTDEWLRLGKGSGGLLDDVELAEADRWLNGNDAIELGYDTTLLELVAMSARSLQEAQQREEKAKQRELELLSEKLKQEKKARQIAQFRNLIAGISILLLASLTSLIIKQNIESKIQTLAALTSSSEALLVSHKQLEALIEAIKAGKLLKQRWSFFIPADVKLRTITTLHKAVYEIQEKNRLQGHRDKINTVRFSQDGERLVTTSKDGTIKIWKRDGTLVKTIDNVQAESARFSPDGQTIASANSDKTIKLWDFDGKLIGSLSGHNERVYDVSFSPDRATLASASGDKTIKLWSLDGKLRKTLSGHQDEVYSIRFSPDGKTLVSGSADRTIRLWDLNGKSKTLGRHNEQVFDVNFSKDGKLLISTGDDKIVKLWDLYKKKLIRTIPQSKSALEVSFSPDDRTIASANEDNTIKLWSKAGELLQELKGHNNSVVSLAFSPDGKRLASSSLDRTVMLWNLARKKPITFQAHQSLVRSVNFSPNSQFLASASHDKSIKIWNQKGQLLQTLKGHQDLVRSISFSADNQLIASASRDRTVKLWNIDGKLLHTFQGHAGLVTSVSFSPISQILASASEDGTIKLWNLDGKLLRTIVGSEPLIYVSFSKNGKKIISVDATGTLEIWTTQGQLISTLKTSRENIIAAHISPNDEKIALASKDGYFTILKPNSKVLSTFSSHGSWVVNISFSADSQIIISSSADRTVKLWSLGGRLLQTFSGNSEFLSATFSPEGKMIATGSFDGTVTLWNLDLENLLQRGCKHLHDYLKIAYSLNPSERTLCTN